MEERPELVRLTDRRSAGGSLLAVAVVALIAVAIVGVGLLGGSNEPPPFRAASENPARTVEAAPSPDVAPADPPTVTQVAYPGYRIAADWPPGGSQLVFDTGHLVVFSFEKTDGRVPAIVVSVGTPARGASLLGEGVAARVHGESLDELQAEYLRVTGITDARIDEIELDGETARRLRLAPPGEWSSVVLLVVHAHRSFVITAMNFDDRPRRTSWTAEADRSLETFLSAFHFGTGLFVSEPLGFQVDLLVDERPFGATIVHGPDAVGGLYVFGDGERLGGDETSHSIGISVGTELLPAFVRNQPSALPPPAARRIWADSLAGLVRGYRRSVDGGDGLSVPTTLGGAPAMLLIRADGLAATVLAARGGRVYIISTTGALGPERAPHFDQFLATFTFLE